MDRLSIWSRKRIIINIKEMEVQQYQAEWRPTIFAKFFYNMLPCNGRRTFSFINAARALVYETLRREGTHRCIGPNCEPVDQCGNYRLAVLPRRRFFLPAAETTWDDVTADRFTVFTRRVTDYVTQRKRRWGWLKNLNTLTTLFVT